ncbi:hypothetical protein PACILC2_53290 [Paenibacillus cisolokensis]|uniref:Uncharacterized protein n=1 Tax=Paenibacillus cisolokensis TaxID=1658519 RepID=A0ABQ4NEV8_9BACL|nr:hypothetical protein [Paenibacillus cisolokensis]GIQ66761.1 hypothetical protein PACILC2_53290 [Paenibacillus cisolokensis]
MKWQSHKMTVSIDEHSSHLEQFKDFLSSWTMKEVPLKSCLGKE